MIASAKSLAQYLRHLTGADGHALDSYKMETLAAYCQRLGQSGRGTKRELIERIYRRIWNKEYDGETDDK